MKKKEIIILSLKINFVLVNSADPDEMPHYASLFAKVPVKEFRVYKRVKKPVVGCSFCLSTLLLFKYLLILDDCKILITEKPVLSGHSKIDKSKILMTDGSLM